jgi:hypothetical protein
MYHSVSNYEVSLQAVTSNKDPSSRRRNEHISKQAKVWENNNNNTVMGPDGIRNKDCTGEANSNSPDQSIGRSVNV